MNKLIKKISKNFNEQIIRQNDELIWANVYHDSIRGIEYLENLALNIGRWAGSYAFFYVLNRILHSYNPQKIIEFGLGESTKFISSYAMNNPIDSHIVIEHNHEWKNAFNKNFKVSDKTDILIHELHSKTIAEDTFNSYKGIEEHTNNSFDLYIVDGPLGTRHKSRYDIVSFAEKFNKESDFIIILDDVHRKGEKETLIAILNVCKSKNIKIHHGIYSGTKDLAVIASSKYPFIGSF